MLGPDLAALMFSSAGCSQMPRKTLHASPSTHTHTHTHTLPSVFLVSISVLKTEMTVRRLRGSQCTDLLSHHLASV